MGEGAKNAVGQGADQQALAALLAGPEGSSVGLTLRGRDGKLRDVTMERVLLPPETELQLMRIMQEAISNVRKHSQAGQAHVTLEQPDESLLEMTISDNGIGFDVTSIGTKGQPHFGLATMRERAESIGASFDVKSSPASGTVVFVTLSLAEKN